MLFNPSLLFNPIFRLHAGCPVRVKDTHTVGILKQVDTIDGIALIQSPQSSWYCYDLKGLESISKYIYKKELNWAKEINDAIDARFH